jgi:hypothetical protein
MREYIDNGSLLGWLIHTQDNQVEIYRKGQSVEILENPIQLSGEDVLPGFLLNLKRLNVESRITVNPVDNLIVFGF